MLSPNSTSTSGFSSASLPQVGHGLFWSAHEPNAIFVIGLPASCAEATLAVVIASIVHQTHRVIASPRGHDEGSPLATSRAVRRRKRPTVFVQRTTGPPGKTG